LLPTIELPLVDITYTLRYHYLVVPLWYWYMKTEAHNLVRCNQILAKKLWGPSLDSLRLRRLAEITSSYSFSLLMGDMCFLQGSWYITHAGLIRLARRRRCAGIEVEVLAQFCDPKGDRWFFKAIVYKSPKSGGFVGYGDADPSNVSPIVHGAEMRVAETRAVNRALRKAYGIGICSVEEIGSFAEAASLSRESKKLPPQPVNGNGNGGRTVRDRLCQLIRQHQLDATAVKSYATEFCGVKTLRDATREQVENFVAHLAEQAEKDRSALVCQLISHRKQVPHEAPH
jgi:hypothetical protein